MSQPQSKEFRALQAVWDKKLAESGFVEAEERKWSGDSSQMFLKNWHSIYFTRSVRPDYFESTSEYFRRACQCLHDWFFDDTTMDYFGIVDNEKRIWELHCEGFSEREIAVAVRKNRYQVTKVLGGLINKMMGRV